jgi:hypothetical protein
MAAVPVRSDLLDDSGDEELEPQTKLKARVA